MWSATVLTLYPDLFPGPLDASVLGRARGEGRWALDTVNIRDFSDNPYGSVDDTPAGGGAGLVMRVDILAAAIDSVPRNDRPLVYLSPRGRRFDQARARKLAAGPGVIALCGRFEGVDDRLIEARGIEEISLGDFVLAGGEVAAMALIEACVRLLPGVLGSPLSLGEESFSPEEGGSRGQGAGDMGGGKMLLEYPQYTRPRLFEDREIPPVLLSGDHKKIAAWRREKAEQITRARRPDLIASGPIRRDNKDKDQGL
ncbi:MAG: tRNA (guanosine(37)-N1)-methyltransferase TrmD [Alphaproteobacteria bacterium RIFCSPHIGHO2_12_FULL_63_12]|nr:MAG: tRNA (guanosine(37)-N1)-methyltransferase TrmD [Alphaproteobacteria bacterium RIFCSPHIGHO2_12_FULL_63_12]